MVEEFAEQAAVEESQDLIVARPASPADAPLAEQVVQAIWNYYPVRASVSELYVFVERGAVSLEGVVRTDAQKLVIGEIAGRIEGVRDLHNRLISDDEIARAVGQALAGDARTRSQMVLVRSLHGDVRLVGPRPDARVADAAVSLARQVHGVASVALDFAAD